MSQKPQSSEKEESTVPIFLDEDTPPSPFPTFVTRHTLEELLGTKYSATLESIRSIHKKNERS